MKPPAFDYHAPDSIDAALSLLADPDADTIVLAGGQSLMPLLNLRMALPERLVDINRVGGLDRIEIDDGRVRIGALARLSTIEHDEELRHALPVLGEALRFVAHPQIRNRSTLGGTLCHADPTAEIPVTAVAFGAQIELASSQDRRTVPAQDFFRSVFQTAKNADELLVAVEFPRLRGFEFGFDEIARRSHGDFPYVSLCLGLRLEGREVVEARLGAGGVAERPIRLPAAEDALAGRRVDDDLGDVLKAASEEVSPPNDIHGSSDFRRGLLRTLIRRTIGRLGERTAQP